MAVTPEQFARKLNVFSKELVKAQKRGVQDVAVFVDKNVEQEIDRAAPSGRLNTSKRGSNVGVRWELLGSRPTNPGALVKATGKKFHLLERPTKAHDIRPKTFKTKKGARALKLRNEVFRGKVRHPGTKGKFPFAKGVARSLPHTKAVFFRASRGVIRSTFMGG